MRLTAIFHRDSNKINKQCKLAITNNTGPNANYLDQGNWAISVKEPTQMEIKYTDHTHFKTLQPPITLINLQPACSAFSPKLNSNHTLNNIPKVSLLPSRLQTFICPNSSEPILEFGYYLIYLKLLLLM